MKPEELRALQNDRVFGECLETGVANGVVWEVREHAKCAPWRPDTEREARPVDGEYRITIALSWSERLRSDHQWRGATDEMIAAERVVKSMGSAAPKYPSLALVGTIEAHPSLEAAIESARSWCRTAARGGYVPSP
jgi:hypothetical protein